MHRVASGALASTSCGSSGLRPLAVRRAPQAGAAQQCRALPAAAGRAPMYTAPPGGGAEPAALLQQQLESARSGLSQLQQLSPEVLDVKTQLDDDLRVSST